MAFPPLTQPGRLKQVSGRGFAPRPLGCGNQHCVRVREGGEVLATVNLDRGAFACALSRRQDPSALGERLATVLADPARPAKDEQIDAAE